MPSICKNIYGQILSNIEAPLLADGFHRKYDDCFLKWEGDCLKRLSFDYTKYCGVEHAAVGINAAVGFKSLTKFLQSGGCYVGVSRMPAVMVTNIGYLRPPYKYQTWSLDEDSKPEAIAAQAFAEIQTHVYPFFSRYASVDEVLEALLSGVSYNLGINDVFFVAGIYWLKGRFGDAITVMQASIAHFQKDYETHKESQDWNRLTERKAFLNFLVETGEGRRTAIAPKNPVRSRIHARIAKTNDLILEPV